MTESYKEISMLQPPEPLVSALSASQTVNRLKDVRQRLLPCRAPFWAAEGHLQTIFGHLIPSAPLREHGQKHLITLEKDDEQLVSTYLKGRSTNVVYLFHGLGGHSHGSYMQRTAVLAQKLGYHVFLNNHRGCGLGAGLATAPYHSGRAEDLSAVIAYGRKMLPGHRHIAVGFSLSANALLLLAAGIRAEILPDAAIAVNAPIDLDHCSRNLDRGVNLLYSYNFMLDLRKSLTELQRVGRIAEKVRLPILSTVRDFDSIYTATAGGFTSRDHYYDTCSAAQYLRQIQIPTLVLTAANDPFVDIADYKKATLSDQAVLHIEENGGHMGYITRDKTPLGNHRWLDYALNEYLLALA
jgi:predicted alpha/beta-fold hydrolase